MEDVDNGTIYSEVGQLLVSVGAKHAECTTTPPLVRKEEKKRIAEEEEEEEEDSHIPGGFTLDLDEVEREEEEEEEGEGEGEGEGEEEGDGEVIKKPEQQRHEKLQKVMSGYDLTGWYKPLSVYIIIHNTCSHQTYIRQTL